MSQRRLVQWIRRSVWAALAVWLAVGGSAWAQGILIANLDAIDTSAYPTMRALVTVTDENGIPVRDLDAKAFELNDDGRGTFAPDKVEVVANQKAAVSVMIVVDLSGTMRGKPLQAAKEAVAKFLEALLNEPNDPDRAAFIGFTQKVKVTDTAIADTAREVEFTNDMGKLLNVINFVDVDTGTGGTPLYDAIFRSVKITAQQPGRRVILLMTDGKDQGSTLTASDPIDEANRQRIPIFPIGLSTGRLDVNYLQRVAVRTGGQYQSAPTPDELTQLFQNVLAQLKEQYVLTYTSRAPKDGQSHTLTVQVTTSRGQNSSKLTYVLGQPAAPTVSAVSATPAPGATPAPSATPIPASGGTDMMQWISENMILVIAIAAAGLLLLLMLIIAIVLVARRKGAPQEAYDGGAYPQPSFQEPTFPGAPSPAGAPVSGGLSSMPTVSPGGPTASGAPTSAGTQLASATPPPVVPTAFQPSASPAFPVTPAAPKTAEKPVTPPTSGGTVIIQRGPKMKFLGMLVDKKQSSKRFDINKQSVTVGRAPGNDLIVEHPTVSRQHAAIKIEGEDFRLYDLGSANGTFVNDQRLRDPMVLQDGMTVRFGEIEYIFKRISLE